MRKLPLLAAAGTAAYLFTRYRRQRHQISFQGKSVVISGGSRGLGLELARRFAREGARLTLLARDADELARARQELARLGGEVQVFTCDIARQPDVQEAIHFVLNHYGRIDVLVNNAGVIQVGPIEHQELEDFQEALDVHAWGPLYLMEATVPHMRRQGGGRIINIASIGGLVSIPHLVPYSMSKFALVGLSNGMRAELAKDDIRITTVCPGLMRTGSHMNAWFKGQHEKEFAWFSMANALPLFSTSSDRAARQIVDAGRYGDPFLIITPQARLLYTLNATFPNLMAGFMKLTNRSLPGPTGRQGDVMQRGRHSTSAVAPSLLTQPADEAVPGNNEQYEPDRDA